MSWLRYSSKMENKKASDEESFEVVRSRHEDGEKENIN